jgi:hypothetical protein
MMVVAGPSARGHVRLAHPDLLRSGVLARDSLAAGHPRGLAGVGAKFPAAYVDERLVPAVLGHHASNYLLNLAIISDIIVAWYATRSHPAGAPLDAAVLHDHEGFVPFFEAKEFTIAGTRSPNRPAARPGDIKILFTYQDGRI